MPKLSAAAHPFEGLSVPAAAAQLAAPDVVEPAALVRVGDRVEVDLATVAATHGGGVASRLARFWADTRRGAVRGDLPTVTRRVLVDDRQDTGRAKRDLDEALDELDAHPFLGALTSVLLTPKAPERKALTAVAGPGSTVRRVGGAVAVTVPAVAPGWPVVLGGAPMPNEVRRWFRLEARHATWRDRRVRRLARLVVCAEERWPVLPGTGLDAAEAMP